MSAWTHPVTQFRWTANGLHGHLHTCAIFTFDHTVTDFSQLQGAVDFLAGEIASVQRTNKARSMNPTLLRVL